MKINHLHEEIFVQMLLITSQYHTGTQIPHAINDISNVIDMPRQCNHLSLIIWIIFNLDLTH